MTEETAALQNQLDALDHPVDDTLSRKPWAAAASRRGFPREVVEMAMARVVADETEGAYFRSDLLERRRKLMEAVGVRYFIGYHGPHDFPFP